MKKILFILLVLSINVNAQNTYSEYDVLVTNFTKLQTKIETDEKDLKAIIEMFSANEFYFEYKMKVISNCRYALFFVSLDYSNYPGYKKDTTIEKYFIDYDKNIVYDVNKKSYSKYTPDEIKKNSLKSKDSIFDAIVVSKSDTAIITFDKKLPKCLTNKIIVKNNNYGISKVKTDKQLIVLTLTKNNKFDLENSFKTIKQICTKETPPFNGLFLK
ncbi:MAG: hypothetical protein U0W65_09570 [Bacteroidia bacterium]